jgi:hypothetical protein
MVRQIICIIYIFVVHGYLFFLLLQHMRFASYKKQRGKSDHVLMKSKHFKCSCSFFITRKKKNDRVSAYKCLK